MCDYWKLSVLHSKHWNIGLQWMWLFWASFGRIQINLSYLTDNFPKQEYRVLFFPYPATTMKIIQKFWRQVKSTRSRETLTLRYLTKTKSFYGLNSLLCLRKHHRYYFWKDLSRLSYLLVEIKLCLYKTSAAKILYTKFCDKNFPI